MNPSVSRRLLAGALVGGLTLTACSGGWPANSATGATGATGTTGSPSVSVAATGGVPASPSGSTTASVPGATAAGTTAGPGVNVYAQAAAGLLAPAAAAAKPMVYVPTTIGNSVQEIDPSTFQVVRRFPVGAVPQHVVPSWDLKTLWVNVNEGNTLVPIDPVTGTPGPAVAVEDPYNLYFTPDGAHALVMAERDQRIDVRDPHTLALQRSLPVPCKGVNHADYTADLSTLLVSCEFSGQLLVIPADLSRVSKVIDLTSLPSAGTSGTLPAGSMSMPQDVRLVPDGRMFLAADMRRNGVWEIDAATFAVRGFQPTGRGAHGVYPSRDAGAIYVSNRDEGSVSVLDPVTAQPKTVWRIPGGGSPDMGGVSADGSRLWLSGRSNGEVYVFDTTSGQVVRRVATDAGPHGLCVWPQPGRFSLGHTGNLR